MSEMLPAPHPYPTTAPINAEFQRKRFLWWPMRMNSNVTHKPKWVWLRTVIEADLGTGTFYMVPAWISIGFSSNEVDFWAWRDK